MIIPFQSGDKHSRFVPDMEPRMTRIRRALVDFHHREHGDHEGRPELSTDYADLRRLVCGKNQT